MAETTASLWAREIRPDVLSPFAILEPQAQALVEQTSGILVGEVKLAHDEDKTILNLDIVVPALENYRRRILSVTPDSELIYPAQIEAEYFRLLPPYVGHKASNEAATDREFRDLIEKVLQSDAVKSVGVSLIARAKDTLKAKQQKAEEGSAKSANRRE